MARTQTPSVSPAVVPLDRPTLLAEAQARLEAARRLVRALEDELDDPELDDDQRLQNIGERLASFRDDEEGTAPRCA